MTEERLAEIEAEVAAHWNNQEAQSWVRELCAENRRLRDVLAIRDTAFLNAQDELRRLQVENRGLLRELDSYVAVERANKVG